MAINSAGGSGGNIAKNYTFDNTASGMTSFDMQSALDELYSLVLSQTTSLLFNTHLYTGTGTTQNVDGGVYIATDGGMLWIKKRSGVSEHYFFNTLSGANTLINMPNIGAETVVPNTVTEFTTSGFTLGTASQVNSSSSDYVVWQFKKTAGFFDVVKYVGDGIAGKQVPISLGEGTATFGMCILFDDDGGYKGVIQHKETGGTVGGLYLSSGGLPSTDATIFNNTAATATALTLGTSLATNESGVGYTAYLFAHNPTKGIYCGTYTGTGVSNTLPITTGFPVGWVITKSITNGSQWYIYDNARGSSLVNGIALIGSSTAGDTPNFNGVQFDADGFSVTGDFNNVLAQEYIFMAISNTVTNTI